MTTSVTPAWKRPELPRPTVRSPRDYSQPWVDRRRIAERIHAEHALETELAKLAEVVEGVPARKTLSALRTEAMQNIPALQPDVRVRSQSGEVAQRLDNVKTLLAELSDMQDFVFATPERVSLRALLETLRHVEVELEATVGRLAGELGLLPLNPLESQFS